MKWTSAISGSIWCLIAAGWMLVEPKASAYPPAPYHVVYGLVRDDYGTPIMTSQALVILETPTGVQIATSLSPGLAPGVNYQLEVPMDAGVAADPYRATALETAAPFKMVVVIGTITNLPLQMTGNFSLLGQPAQKTRIDLTLGADTNGDGIPDAWELAYLAALGSNQSLGNINANSVLGSDGLTVLQEFLAGYYPYDPADTFTLRLIDIHGGSPILEFTAITGRSYTVLGSSDLHSWFPLSFRVPAEGSSGPVHSYYFAPTVQTLRVQAIQPGLLSQPTLGFSRAGGRVVLSWSTNAPGYNLVSATSLRAPVWSPVAASPLIVGDRYVITNAPTGSGQFYRLSFSPVHFFKLMLQ
jgi:hypothetical protein